MPKIHDNPTRDEWSNKIGSLNDLKKAVDMLIQFRLDHTTPLRKTYELDNDYLWIEAKLEEKVAVLKIHAFSDNDFIHKTATGEDAKSVCDAWIKKMNAASDKMAAERIHIEFRQRYKTPVMPVNYFFDADRQLGSRLMELRNIDQYTLSLADFRKQRGVRVVHLQAGVQ